MARIACATLLALLALTAPAQAFQTCDHSGTTVTATFGTATTGTLSQSGTQIRADGVQCDGATTTNTDRIDVVGDLDHEVLTIDLSGGTFLEGDAPDEIEIHVNFGEESDPPEQGDSFFPMGTPEIVVLGSEAAADHVTVGMSGPVLPRSDRFNELNLNANEPDPKDVDVTVADRRFIDVRGRGGEDVLSAAGGNGGGSLSGDPLTTLDGGNGNDDLTAGYMLPGPGNDTLRAASTFTGIASFFNAPGAVTVTATNGGGAATGAGGNDTLVGSMRIVGSDTGADTFTAAPAGSTMHGAGGGDTFNGGPSLDWFDGGAGEDTLHGEGDEDWLFGGPDHDVLHGGDGDDDLDGQGGPDEEHGGPGLDVFDQYGTGFGAVPQPGPNGADQLHGGPDADFVAYGNGNEFDPDPIAVGVGRTAAVSIDADDVADDGAAGEGDNVRSDIENMAGGRGGDTIVGTAAENFVLAFDGADTVMVRGGGADTVYCGAGDDLVRADASDVPDPSCDRVELTDPPPPEPPVQPPADPPADPPVQPLPPVQPPVGPPVQPPAAAPPVSQLLALPSSRRCASRRKFTVRVRREIRGQVRRVTIFLNGRRVKSVTGTRIGLPIDLRGLPRGTIRVRLRVELVDGRVATDTRRYRTCATKKRRGQFGRRRRG